MPASHRKWAAKPSHLKCSRGPSYYGDPNCFGGNQLVKLLKAKEVSQILGVSERQVWRLASSGQMPAPVTVGGSTRWRLSDIEAWIANGCRMRRSA